MPGPSTLSALLCLLCSLSMRASTLGLCVGASRVLAAALTATDIASEVSNILDISSRVNISLVRNQAVSASTERCV